MKKSGFTLVEIMIVVAIIGLLAAIAVPAYMKARSNARRSACINNLRLIESAKDNYAIDYGGSNGVALVWNNLCFYVKDLTNKCFCPAALLGSRAPTNYQMNVIGVDAECLIVGFPGGHCLTNAAFTALPVGGP